MKEIRCVIPMRTAKVGYIVLSALFCALGGFILVRPEVSALLLGRFSGVCMIAFGVVKVIGYFSKDLYRLAFQYDFAFGALLVALGILVLTRPESTMGFFACILGLCILSDGLFKVQMAMDARAFGLERWWLILALAVASVALGIALVFYPAQRAQVLTVLLGLSILFEGLLNLCVALSAVKIVPHQRTDEKEA